MSRRHGAVATLLQEIIQRQEEESSGENLDFRWSSYSEDTYSTLDVGVSVEREIHALFSCTSVLSGKKQDNNTNNLCRVSALLV